ncbi:hypothetical protein [Sediminibacterium sp.]|uniref:hypothetical protein n=1 Tax=Sediminibacterium sp. TaxID=1917865 RepID=UPI002735E9AC|nr:hypothetical protein [Sediminibacterium sp.]MDP3394028.1 hypothetical protein [Sediminibacterium sp.]MDP3568965.1 hypothetical protein [Sediminibacterium sp.]
MSEVINNSNINNSDEISLKELLQKMNKWWSYLKTHWIKIVFIGLIGGAIGFIYAWMQPANYVAKITFVVEENKSNSSSLSGLASLAGQFGVDLGSNNGGSILSGENILLFFKSNTLTREVLLSKFDETTDKLFVDVYAEKTGIANSWKDKPKYQRFNFLPNKISKNYSRDQDSILNSIIFIITSSQLEIKKVDKKASFLEVSITMPDEELAKIYCEKIVKTAVDKYLSVKTKGQIQTINRLQERVDSIAALLNSKTISSADLQTSSNIMDINPMYKKNNIVSTEKTTRDKFLLSSMYTEVIKNLELAKFSLSQETPVIQIIDQPYYPLLIKKTSKRIAVIIGGILFGILIIAYLVFIKMYKDIL